MNNLEKPLVEFSRSNEYQRCSNTMSNSPPIERWDILMNVNLRKSKERSKFMFNQNSIKESKPIDDKSNE
jgi:hypothetical protein